MNVAENADAPTVTLFALGVGLTGLAVVNYLDGAYGGAMLAGIGGVVAFAFVLLTD